MANFPGFFSAIKLGDGQVDDPGDKIDLGALNFAIVMHEDDEPVAQRFTTWGMGADSATLYQTLSNFNKIIIGNNGAVYALEEDVHSDDGVAIPVTVESGPLPEATPDESTTMQHRVHRIVWQISTPPPTRGHRVTIKLTDVDDSTNFTQLIIQQTETKLLLPMTITARQFRIRITVSVTQDYDPISFGYTYQSLNRPYWKE